MALTGRIILVTALGAFLLAGCGSDDDSAEAEAAQLTVCESIEGQAPEGLVRVDGTAHAIPTLDSGFVLTDGGCAVFVAAPLGETPIERRAEVWIEGRIAALTAQELERVEFVLDHIAGRDVMRGAPVEADAPFITAYSVQDQPYQ